MGAMRIAVVGVLVAALLMSAYVFAAGFLGDSGCCKSPPCAECFSQKGFCDCELREMLGLGKIGLGECQECEAAGCGEGFCGVKE